MARETCDGQKVPLVRLALEKQKCVRPPAPRVVTPVDVAGYMNKLYGCKPQEFFAALFLDSRGAVLAIQEVAMGALNQTMVDPRVLFAGAISAGATAIILVHNHPSGSADPSADDVKLTQQLVDGGVLLNIRVMDHIIVARGGGWSSFLNMGLMPGRSTY